MDDSEKIIRILAALDRATARRADLQTGLDAELKKMEIGRQAVQNGIASQVAAAEAISSLRVELAGAQATEDALRRDLQDLQRIIANTAAPVETPAEPAAEPVPTEPAPAPEPEPAP